MSIEQFKTELSELIGVTFEDGFAEVAEAAKTTLPKATKPLGIAYPRYREDVQELLSLCEKYKVKTKVVSVGKNWGYGDMCAPEDGYLIISLKKMNRILAFNEALGYVVIQAGVTQGQLANRLEGTDYMLDVTGAGPDASVVGNILQRGFGHTPYGDKFANSCNYVAVSADQVLTSGIGGISADVYPYSQGPDIKGLLAQSELMVVTEMTVWLQPRPERISAFCIKTDDLAQIVPTLSQLKQKGIVTSVPHIANDSRIFGEKISISRGLGTPMSEEQRQELRKSFGIKSWNCLGGIYGTKALEKATKKEIKKAFKGKVQFISPWKLKMMNFAHHHFGFFGRPCNMLNPVFETLQGNPTEGHLKNTGVDNGLIWLSVVVPMTSYGPTLVTKTLTKVARNHGFELPITISPVFARSAICVTNLHFPSYSPGWKQKAIDCYKEMEQTAESLGYNKYRDKSVNF